MMHLDASLVKLGFSNNSLICYIPDEMVMGVWIRVKEVDKNLILPDPAAGDEWVWKVIVQHGVIIKTNQLVNLDLSLFDLLLIPLLFAKDTQPKQPIVKVDTGKLLPIMILLHLFDFDVLLLIASDLFFKSLFETLDRVHFDPTLIFHVLWNCDGSSGVIRYYHRLDWVPCHYAVLFHQICKDIAVSVQLFVCLNGPSVSLGVSVC